MPCRKNTPPLDQMSKSDTKRNPEKKRENKAVFFMKFSSKMFQVLTKQNPIQKHGASANPSMNP